MPYDHLQVREIARQIRTSFERSTCVEDVSISLLLELNVLACGWMRTLLHEEAKVVVVCRSRGLLKVLTHASSPPSMHCLELQPVVST